jgi:hypothetical protein
LNPLTGITVTLNIMLERGGTLTEAGAVMVKSVPVPVSETVRGLPLALSVIVMVPLRAPVAVGVNVTLIVQFMLAGTDAPHVFVSAKSPEAVIEVIFSARLPLLVSVIIFAGELVVVTSWLPKFKLVGATTATGALAVPVPVSVANWALLGSTSVNTSLAISVAATEGVNVTLTLHEAPAARLAPHVFDEIAKSVAATGGAVATIAMFVMASAVELLFVNMIVCGAVVAPTSCVPKSTLVGDTATASSRGNFATNASELPLRVV